MPPQQRERLADRQGELLGFGAHRVLLVLVAVPAASVARLIYESRGKV
jgi:hypothetical protein